MNRMRARATSWQGRVKPISMILGIAASCALAALSLTTSDQTLVKITIPQAGSGSAPANTTFTQPVVGSMNLGATVAATTPGSVLATTKAAPAVKPGR